MEEKIPLEYHGPQKCHLNLDMDIKLNNYCNGVSIISGQKTSTGINLVVRILAVDFSQLANLGKTENHSLL